MVDQSAWLVVYLCSCMLSRYVEVPYSNQTLTVIRVKPVRC